jgi:hypothetical protein
MASIAIRRKSCENFVSARDFEVVLGRKTRPFTFNLIGVFTGRHQPQDIVFWGMDEDYPKTLLELERRFCTGETCVEYLAALRWPGGWVCPWCAGADA